MTSELQTRPARSRYSAASDTHAADDGAQQRPGRTHGRPRRSRERRRAAAMVALCAVPVLVMGGIAATVIVVALIAGRLVLAGLDVDPGTYISQFGVVVLLAGIVWAMVAMQEE